MKSIKALVNVSLQFNFVLLSKSFHFTEPDYIQTIKDAMRYISDRSCITFAPKASYDEDYYYIKRGEECSSLTGRTQGYGKHELTLKKDYCPYLTVIHGLFVFTTVSFDSLGCIKSRSDSNKNGLSVILLLFYCSDSLQQFGFVESRFDQ